jgi:hypothetical protein
MNAFPRISLEAQDRRREQVDQRERNSRLKKPPVLPKMP